MLELQSLVKNPQGILGVKGRGTQNKPNKKNSMCNSMKVMFSIFLTLSIINK
jgi:hypothetical protein